MQDRELTNFIYITKILENNDYYVKLKPDQTLMSLVRNYPNITIKQQRLFNEIIETYKSGRQKDVDFKLKLLNKARLGKYDEPFIKSITNQSRFKYLTRKQMRAVDKLYNKYQKQLVGIIYE